jgi:DNA sulfur modification protein DndB
VVDSDTALIVECKSASKRTRSSFSKDIAEIVGIKDDILKRLKNQIKRSLKVRWVFATNNIIVTAPDAARMEENEIVHFHDDDMDYYEQLANLLGSTAKYQLLGRLFKDQKIEGLKYSTPAIRGHLGGFNPTFCECLSKSSENDFLCTT